MPHVTVVSVDGEVLGPVELDHTDPPDGTLVTLDRVELRVVGRIDADDTERQLDVLVVEEATKRSCVLLNRIAIQA